MAHSFVSGVEVDGHTVDPHPEDAQHCKVAAAHDEHLNILLSRSSYYIESCNLHLFMARQTLLLIFSLLVTCFDITS